MTLTDPALAGNVLFDTVIYASAGSNYGAVPALVPYGPKLDATSATCSARADKCTSTLSAASPTDTDKYGDVIEFIRTRGGDASTIMACPIN